MNSNIMNALHEIRTKLPFGDIAYEINSYIFTSHPGAIEFQKNWRTNIIKNVNFKLILYLNK